MSCNFHHGQLNFQKYTNQLFFSLGEEVALYCSKYLPDIIKEQKAYKDGKLQKVRPKIKFSVDTF